MNAHVQIIEPGESAPPPSGNALMPRNTVEQIVGLRNKALEKFERAYSALLTASEAQKAAYDAWHAAAPRELDRFTYNSHEEKNAFIRTIKMIPKDDYLASARKFVDIDVWAHVIKLTNLETLMDKEAREAFAKDLNESPPEATVENITATLEQFACNAETIFRRGIANAFSKLDRRFRSHDGFKIGSRVILDRMFDDSGFYNYHRDMESTLFDIARTFLTLDGSMVPPHYAGIVGDLRQSRWTGHGPRRGEIEDEYFLIRVYKNGNCHLWFKRDDLVEKVNKLLAEYYGEVIPDGMTPDDDGGLFTPKTTLAKRYGFYPTPASPADAVIEEASVRHHSHDEPPLTILEPSAGTGNLARRCIPKPIVAGEGNCYDEKRVREINSEYRFDHQVDCVEIQPHLADALRAEGVYRKVWCQDFLTMQPDPDRLYDRVVMNPPFDRERDIDHVMHALRFLKPNGMLISIMSAGTEFRETRKSIAFRELIKEMRGSFTDLPPNSFSSVGTHINTIIVKVYADKTPVRLRWRRY